MNLLGHPCPERVCLWAGFSREHEGVDYAAHEGTPVIAAREGVVRIGNQEGGYGLYVKVQGFIDGAPLNTLYAHLSAVTVEEGAWVRRGQMIGRVGQTGRANGPHLHFEVEWQGAKVDPLKYMEEER